MTQQTTAPRAGDSKAAIAARIYGLPWPPEGEAAVAVHVAAVRARLEGFLAAPAAD